MLPPLPRCSGWAYSSLISPSHVSLPRKGHRVGLHIVLFEACSAFTRVAACTLARSPYFVTRYPKASDISSPPCLPRLLPAGANRRVGLAPTGKAPPSHGARGRQSSSSSSRGGPRGLCQGAQRYRSIERAVYGFRHAGDDDEADHSHRHHVIGRRRKVSRLG